MSGVQKRRLADVRVARECDLRRLRAHALFAPRRAPALDILEAVPQHGDPAACDPAVGLELRLARPACADAAAEPFEVLPHPAHARQVVFELRELDLQLPLGGDGVLGEDVEDQLRPVDDPCLQRVLEEPLLHRIELVVDDQALSVRRSEALLDLLELALADVGALRRPRAVLHDATDGLDAGCPGELLDLCELGVGVFPLGQNREDQSPLWLRGLWNHRLKYAPFPA